MEGERYYITTAISYPNGPPHIGHAYEAAAADVFARFYRLEGRDVRFMTGTDEHGQKMERAAKERGITPRELADENAKKFEEMCELLDVSADRFIRTSEEMHHEGVRALWEKLEKNGDVYLGEYEGWYSVRDEAYFGEEELTRDEDGRFRAPSGALVERVSEESFFFRLSAYGEKLLTFYEENPTFVSPETRHNEIVSFVKGGLKDLSISRRTLEWGVEAPRKGSREGKHMVYVWLDALSNYITGLGYPHTDGELWKYWPADLHMVGKDIMRFHTVYWPAFLMSAGVEPPRKVFGHGFLKAGGEKMSKSVGNVLDPKELLGVFGSDALRYALLRDTPFGEDGNLSLELMAKRVNADLANDVGNLAQRCLTVTRRDFGGKVPGAGEYDAADEMAMRASEGMLSGVREAMGELRPDKALWRVLDAVGALNRYFAKGEPWKGGEKAGTTLYVTLEGLRRVGLIMLAFTPRAAGRLLDYLGVGERACELGGEKGGLEEGGELGDFEPLFPRLDVEALLCG